MTNSPIVKILIAAICAMACAAQAEEFTAGAKELFQEFSSCQMSTFKHVKENQEKYSTLGKLKPTLSGAWFATKASEEDSNTEIYRFAKPVTIAGLVGSSRVDLQACKLEYSIVSPK